eukprot:g52735.t1
MCLPASNRGVVYRLGYRAGRRQNGKLSKDGKCRTSDRNETDGKSGQDSKDVEDAGTSCSFPNTAAFTRLCYPAALCHTVIAVLRRDPKETRRNETELQSRLNEKNQTITPPCNPALAKEALKYQSEVGPVDNKTRQREPRKLLRMTSISSRSVSKFLSNLFTSRSRKLLKTTPAQKTGVYYVSVDEEEEKEHAEHRQSTENSVGIDELLEEAILIAAATNTNSKKDNCDHETFPQPAAPQHTPQREASTGQLSVITPVALPSGSIDVAEDFPETLTASGCESNRNHKINTLLSIATEALEDQMLSGPLVDVPQANDVLEGQCSSWRAVCPKQTSSFYEPRWAGPPESPYFQDCDFPSPSKTPRSLNASRRSSLPDSGSPQSQLRPRRRSLATPGDRNLNTSRRSSLPNSPQSRLRQGRRFSFANLPNPKSGDNDTYRWQPSPIIDNSGQSTTMQNQTRQPFYSCKQGTGRRLKRLSEENFDRNFVSPSETPSVRSLNTSRRSSLPDSGSPQSQLTTRRRSLATPGDRSVNPSRRSSPHNSLQGRRFSFADLPTPNSGDDRWQPSPLIDNSGQSTPTENQTRQPFYSCKQGTGRRLKRLSEEDVDRNFVSPSETPLNASRRSSLPDSGSPKSQLTTRRRSLATPGDRSVNPSRRSSPSETPSVCSLNASRRSSLPDSGSPQSQLRPRRRSLATPGDRSVNPSRRSSPSETPSVCSLNASRRSSLPDSGSPQSQLRPRRRSLATPGDRSVNPSRRSSPHNSLQGRRFSFADLPTPNSGDDRWQPSPLIDNSGQSTPTENQTRQSSPCEQGPGRRLQRSNEELFFQRRTQRNHRFIFGDQSVIYGTINTENNNNHNITGEEELESDTDKRVWHTLPLFGAESTTQIQ